MWCREYLFPSTFMGQFSVAYSSLPAFNRRTVFTTRMKTRTHHTKHIEMVCREAPKKSAKHVNARFLCEYKLGNTQTDRLLSLVGRKGVPWLVFAGVSDGASASCLSQLQILKLLIPCTERTLNANANDATRDFLAGETFLLSSRISLIILVAVIVPCPVPCLKTMLMDIPPLQPGPK